MEILAESAHREQGYTEESLGRRGLLRVVACGTGWDGKSFSINASYRTTVASWLSSPIRIGGKFSDALRRRAIVFQRGGLNAIVTILLAPDYLKEHRKQLPFGISLH